MHSRRDAARLVDVEAEQHAKRARERRRQRHAHPDRGRIGHALLVEADRGLDHVLQRDAERQAARPRAIHTERQRRNHA